MSKRGGNISLTSYDDIFETDESRAESQLERVQNISISELVPFKDHPFKVVDDEAMLRTTESIAQYGVLTPLIARPLEGGGYEIISGHRRAHAAEMAGLTEVPVLVRQMDDDAATVLMVDSNLQRENILPSERAYAYKMKLEALKHQGERSDLTSGQLGPKLRSDEQLAQEAGESRKQVQRYIRLTNLIPELLEMVDQKQISFNPAVELSYLAPEEQEIFMQAMDVWGGSSPSTSFDCSGFVSWVINHCGNGWNVGRLTASGLMNHCSIIRPSEAKPGDLIFFQGTYNTSGASHVGIYVGNGMMIHCGNPISYASINTSYWQQHFYCYGRIPD